MAPKLKVAKKVAPVEEKTRAKSYSVAEAFAVLHGTDKVARADAARRLPLFATSDASEIVAAITFVSARVVERHMREAGGVTDEVDEVEVEEEEEEEEVARPKAKRGAKPQEKPAKVKKAGKKAPKEEDDDISDLFEDDDD